MKVYSHFFLMRLIRRGKKALETKGFREARKVDAYGNASIKLSNP